jgi:fructose-bisphosphate aldolase class I
MVIESAYVLWIDEDDDSAILYSRGSRRVSLSDFVEKPESGQIVWMEMDNSWFTTSIKVWPKDPRCGNFEQRKEESKMNELHITANNMVKHGILAADESAGTMDKRLESIGVEQTEQNRIRWRQILASTEDLEEFVSGVILSDDMVKLPLRKGFVEQFAEKGIIPGIKVDKGAKELANFNRERVTEGLDGLRERLAEYAAMGLKFAKWRAVLTPIPSVACVQANAHALARYAALCQEAGLVPIVEPEVLMNGGHNIEVSRQATEAALTATFAALHWQDVDLKGIVLKPNMVLNGYDVGNDPEVVARNTLSVLYDCVPASVPGIAFLSGGQPDVDAVDNLKAMNSQRHPWRLTFSYGRGIQGQALRAWDGKEENIKVAQTTLMDRALKCHNASHGLPCQIPKD